MRNKNDKKNRKNKGFTLIEILVVIAIILVLYSILPPKFNGYRKKAERLRAIDLGRQIYYVVVESYSENNGQFDNTIITNNMKDLLGVNDASVKEATGDEITIDYKIDKEQYSMYFNYEENKFTIKEDNQQIYPVVGDK